ncbi:MAG: pyridoxal phosphate-dependent decarboxylase family protein, partial [Candidatus Kariarchaeaceae archaeon]
KISQDFSNLDPPSYLTNDEMVEKYQSLIPYILNSLQAKDEVGFSKISDPDTIKSVKETITLIGSMTPESTESIDSIFDFLKSHVIDHFNYENTRFFGYIPKSPTNVSMLAESLVPIFSQYIGAAFASPIGIAIESQTIKWIGEILGFTGDFFGSYSMGGSQANLEAMYAGLIAVLPWDVRELGVVNNQRPIVYLTDQAHMCIPKAIRFLGLGNRSLRYIETNEFYQMRPSDLEIKIQEDIDNDDFSPSIIVITAGTTNTGTVDDIEAIAKIAKKYGLWLHVDAAYGGFARIAEHPIAAQFENLHLVDSLAIDTHKWFFTPMEGGLCILKDGKKLKDAYSTSAEYLKDIEIEEKSLVRNFSNYGLALSRKWRGLMVWMNFKFYGKQGISKLITRNILLADYLREKIRIHDDFNPVGKSQLGIVCFTHVGGVEVNNQIFHKFMSEGSKYFIGLTVLKGVSALRICILNEHSDLDLIDSLFDDLVKVAISID